MPFDVSQLLRPGLELVPGYHLVKRLGKGGFGEVWQASGPGGIDAALKCIELGGNASASEQRALEIIRAIRHPNLLTPTAAWTVDNFLVLAMELADRALLDRLLEAQEQGMPGIPREELHDYMLAAASGLDHLNQRKHKLGDREHVGVQHRDVKPQNILLVGGGIKVADFGLARVLEKSRSFHSGHMTWDYAAPEFFKNEISEHSDQYCLAMTYCICRTGRLPFEGDNMFALMQQHLNAPPNLLALPEEERPIVARALAKEPKDRWPSCRAFIEELRKTKSVPVPPLTPVPTLSEAPTVIRPARFYASPTLKMRFVLIPAGTFLMGSPASDKDAEVHERPQHEVEISKPFYLGVYAVTQEEFASLMGVNPSWFCRDGEGQASVRGLETRRFPVERVSWRQAEEFCLRLSDHDRRTYRLPTEAEWEYACRAGATSRYHVGDSLSSKQANFAASRLARPTDVGAYEANPWGLHDMHGNVWEWCLDGFNKDYYAKSPKQDPRNSENLPQRVIRGGSWDMKAWMCRSASRLMCGSGSCNNYLGFRICLPLA